MPFPSRIRTRWPGASRNILPNCSRQCDPPSFRRALPGSSGGRQADCARRRSDADRTPPDGTAKCDPSVARGRRRAPAPSLRNTPTATGFPASRPGRTGCPARHSGCSPAASPATAGPAIPAPGPPSASRAARPRHRAQRRRPPGRQSRRSAAGRTASVRALGPARLGDQQVMWCWIIHRGFLRRHYGELREGCAINKDGMTFIAHTIVGDALYWWVGVIA